MFVEFSAVWMTRQSEQIKIFSKARDVTFETEIDK